VEEESDTDASPLVQTVSTGNDIEESDQEEEDEEAVLEGEDSEQESEEEISDQDSQESDSEEEEELQDSDEDSGNESDDSYDGSDSSDSSDSEEESEEEEVEEDEARPDVTRKTVYKTVPPEDRISLPILYLFEYAKLKGHRISQLAQGAKPLASGIPEGAKPEDIFELEFQQKKVPFKIIRPYPSYNGNGKPADTALQESWDLEELDTTMLLD
jgi:DNA-directed RNA polymerase subunit K/omega